MSINLSQLDLIALKNYLKIVQGFRTSDDPSGDTVAVDGIPSKFIAQASLIQNNNETKLALSRSLVDLAQGLLCINEDGTIKTDVDGNPVTLNANDLMTDLEGISFVKDASKAALNVAEDMRVMRNEMYHMKRDMMVTGALDPKHKVFNGLVDPFKNGIVRYINDKQVIENITSEGIVNTMERGDFTPGQQLIIYNEGYDKHPIAREIIEVNNTEVNVGEFFMDYTPDAVDKTYGVYRNGMFFFGKEDTVRDLDAGNSVHAIIKDGEQRVSVGELNLDKNVQGYATTFTVPASLNQTYLRQIDLILAVNGNPGNIYLEIHPYNEQGIYDPNSDLCIMSNEMQSGKAMNVFRTYSFLLSQDKKLETPGKYVIIIKAKGTSNGNIWKLGGFSEICSLEAHQDTYWVGSDGSLTPEAPDATGYLTDVYLGIGAVKTLEARYIPSKVGAYSGHFTLEQSEATRLRIAFNPVQRDNKNDEFYTVFVKGRRLVKTGDENEWRVATLVKQGMMSNRVWVNGIESGQELIYDFDFDEPVTEVEFQITFNTKYDVGVDVYEGLMSLVVSTDNGIISNSLEDGDK